MKFQHCVSWALSLSFISIQGCTHAPTTPIHAPSNPTADIFYPVIDSHTHTSFSGRPEITSKIPVTQEEYLAEMKRSDVVGTISHTSRTKIPTGYVPDLKEHHVMFCKGIGETIDYREVERGLKNKDFGCIKIYLGYIHRYAYDSKYRPLYTLAQKYDVPVVFHTGDTYSTKGKLKYSDPLTIDEVAVDFPATRFVIAHIGNPWIESAAEVAYKNPNVWIDASALLIGDLKKADPYSLNEYLIKPIRWTFGYLEDPSKLMYGSDWPLTGMKDYIDAVKRAVPERYWDQVLYDNAMSVFRIPGLPATAAEYRAKKLRN